MRGFRLVWAGFVTAIAVALAMSGAQAQSAPSEPAGKPLALLAGLRPPHEAKHKKIKPTVHAKAERGTIKTSAAKTRRSRTAAEHARHVPVQKITRKEHEHRERAVAASAFAEEPPTQTAPNPAPTLDLPAVNTASSADNATAPKMTRMEPPVEVNALGLAAQHKAAPATPATPSNDRTAAVPMSTTQTLLAAPAHRQADPVGSASWIAQVLAALGGAATAGAVAWFLIGPGADFRVTSS